MNSSPASSWMYNSSPSPSPSPTAGRLARARNTPSLSLAPTSPSKRSNGNKRRSAQYQNKANRPPSMEFFENMPLALDFSDLASFSHPHYSNSTTPSPPLTPTTPYTPSFYNANYYPYPYYQPQPQYYSTAPIPIPSYQYPPAPQTPTHSRASSYGDRYANSTFQNSPPPKKLPKPKFLGGASSFTSSSDEDDVFM